MSNKFNVVLINAKTLILSLQTVNDEGQFHDTHLLIVQITRLITLHFSTQQPYLFQRGVGDAITADSKLTYPAIKINKQLLKLADWWRVIWQLVNQLGWQIFHQHGFRQVRSYKCWHGCFYSITACKIWREIKHIYISSIYNYDRRQINLLWFNIHSHKAHELFHFKQAGFSHKISKWHYDTNLISINVHLHLASAHQVPLWLGSPTPVQCS